MEPFHFKNLEWNGSVLPGSPTKQTLNGELAVGSHAHIQVNPRVQGIERGLITKIS
jgi:hypothetical protein